MINRRQFILTAILAALFPAASLPVSAASKNAEGSAMSWDEFEGAIRELADIEAKHNLEHQQLAQRGLNILKQLDLHSESFNQAVLNAYETGNQYWLWQRLIKQRNINGGILNIENKQIVQLHDHPDATGLLRIISGEVEVWQFDQVSHEKNDSHNTAELTRVSHKVLRAGDMAVLTPERGNIHALKSITKTTRMLDFFIPPYNRSERSWYQPQDSNWFDKENIVCKKIPQHEYMSA